MVGEEEGEMFEEGGGESLEDRLQMALAERDRCREDGDTSGQASWLLEVVEIYAQSEAYAEALEAASEAETLYQDLGDSHGEAAAMQAAAQVHMWDSKPEVALEVAEQAVFVSRKAGDVSQEAGLQLVVAQAHMQVRSASEADPASGFAKTRARLAVDAVTKAEMLARRAEDAPLLAYALCERAQACTAIKRTKEAMQASGEASALYRAIGDRQGEAYALLAGGKACLAEGRHQRCWEVAGEALRLFRELGDAEGQALAEAAIEAAESPTAPLEPWLMDAGQQAMLMAQAANRPAAAQTALDNRPGMTGQQLMELKSKIRDTVIDIAGIEDIVDDSPLMNMGLTSQSGVLLRNSLAKQFPGPSLPFTMMFDFPSINSLGEFLSGRTMAQ